MEARLENRFGDENYSFGGSGQGVSLRLGWQHASSTNRVGYRLFVKAPGLLNTEWGGELQWSRCGVWRERGGAVRHSAIFGLNARTKKLRQNSNPKSSQLGLLPTQLPG